ncbi:hypothetical protein ACIBO2_37670 [Nonomuraea sp. NPDC050022]|uniref:hypothetical protein n=1 Tax=unclassified Nonomuraea TaxID=2593643 RepID=UPI003401E16E
MSREQAVISTQAAWQRVALGGLILPLTVIIVLMTPAFLVLPFFACGREFVLKLVDGLTAWARAIVPKADAK